MQKKLLLTYIAIIIITMIFSVSLSWRSVNRYFVDRVDEETEAEAALIKKIVEELDLTWDNIEGQVDELSSIAGLRITLIDSAGLVIADSDNQLDSMDNHLNRPEIKGAKDGQSASNVRYSNTMGKFLLYHATPIETDLFNGYVRVSVPVDEIEGYTLDLIKIIFIGVAVGSILAMVVATFMTNRFMQPINELTRVAKVITEGNYDEKIYLNPNDQVGELAEAFNSMTYTLRKNIWALTQKNAELESILTSMNSGLAAVDTDFAITLYNDDFRKMLNLRDEDLKGRKFYEVVRELTLFDVVEKSIKDQEFLSKETTIDREGDQAIIRVTSTPIYNKNAVHRQLGVLIILVDVTQIRKLETMRRDFVSNVTHELKTPLTSIRGFVDTLKNGAIQEEAVALRFLDIIDIETERLSTLIQDILSLSEIETIVGEKQVDVYDFSEIISEVIDIIPINHEGVEIMTEIDDDLPKFKCNKNRIKQLMINLVDNSMTYTEKGYVKIRAYESSGYLNIIVEDTGVGIEARHLSRIFERFYRVDKGRSRKMGGTGLGLSIVKHIVELYSGEIKIESVVGEGTKIWIKLPY